MEGAPIEIIMFLERPSKEGVGLANLWALLPPNPFLNSIMKYLRFMPIFIAFNFNDSVLVKLMHRDARQLHGTV